MKKSRRTMQVGDVVRNEVSAILQRELHDPALGFVTVTGVEMSPDLRLARIFVSTLGAEGESQQAADGLQKARTRIRFLLGQRAQLRYSPELDFKADLTSLRANSIEKILHEVLPEGEREPEDDHE